MLKVGDKVRVVHNFQGLVWDFVIGHTGVITRMADYDCVELDPPAVNKNKDYYIRAYIFSVREVKLINDGPLPLPG